jgi:hypothetical protein
MSEVEWSVARAAPGIATLLAHRPWHTSPTATRYWRSPLLARGSRLRSPVAHSTSLAGRRR